MKQFLLYTLLLTSPSILANGIDDNCPSFVVWGAPVVAHEANTEYLCRTGYAVDYSNSTKTPVYVVEHLIRAHLSGKFQRTNNFRSDNDLPKEDRSSVLEYEHSGYDKGHMAPADDFTWSAKAMSESFLLSNMVPQNPNNNRGIWKHVEEMQRHAALRVGEVYVISGTIYSTSKHKMIGSVSVPDHLYKIIIDPANKRAIAFLFPNTELAVEDVGKYVVSIKSIEAQTGIKYLPAVPADLAHLESELGDLNQWSLKGPM